MLPLAVMVGEGEYPASLARLFRENLGDQCQTVAYRSAEDAALAFGCVAGADTACSTEPVALLVVVVGDDTPPADELIRPLSGCEAFRETRIVVLSTSLSIKGVDWLVDTGNLDWVGFTEDLRIEAFLHSMRAQIKLFHEHQKIGATPEVSSLFDQPFTDSEIIQKILRRIELSLGAQPRITLPAGVRLTTKGAWVEEVTIILEGSVALIHEGPGGDIVMHEESTGRIIGLLAVSEGRQALLNAVTTSPVTGVRLTVEQLNSSIEGHPDIVLLVATLFIRSLDRRLRRAEELHIENAELSEQVETERSQLATALTNLEEARTELSAQERLVSLGTLAAGIAHELNNPMAAIQRISEHLGDDVLGLVGTAPNKKWSDLAGRALRSGVEAPSLSTRAERQLRRDLTKVTGDPAVAQQLALAGIRDLDLAKRLTSRSNLSLDGARQAASIGTGLRNLRSASTRITQLVSSLRSYARPDGDTVTGIDLHESIDDAVRLLPHKLDGIQLIRKYSDLPPLEGHPGQLAQVWTNILTNAAEAIVEAADQKPGVITIRTSEPTPGWLRVEITDNGPGIPDSILPRIFEPRFTTKSGQVRYGMGIGLGVTRTIVGRHHGTMRIHTGADGTTVVVDLPSKEEQ